MVITVLVPLDVWSTLTSNLQYQPPIGVMWDICYWSTQALTWLVLPFFQVYSDAGDFTVGGKSLTSLKENAILYGSVGAAGVVGIIILVITGYITKSSFGSVKATAMAASNTFGLVVGLLLMGYGLVEIPRNIWRSKPETLLKWFAHKAGRHAEEVMRTTQELEAVVKIIYANQRQMRRYDPMRPYMEIIWDFAEANSPVKPSEIEHRNVDMEAMNAEDLEYNYDKKGMAALRRRLTHAINEYQSARVQYEEVIKSAFELEEIIKAKQNSDYVLREGKINWFTKSLWWYKCVIRQHSRKICALFLAGLSICVVWSEATIAPQKIDLSPFSQILKNAPTSLMSITILVAIPLAYICACTYYALFRITAFNYNKLRLKATTGAALMQNGSLMCRFAAPTCWNYYHMLRMTREFQGVETVFTQKMGAMEPLKIFGQGFNTYLPALLVIHVVLTAFKLWDRLLGMCTSSRYKFSEDDDVEDEYTEKGRALVRKEQEATARGFAIGEVFHTAYVDLEFPGLKKGKSKKLVGEKKSWFSGWKKKEQTAERERDREPAYSTPAAIAASKWTSKPRSDEAQAKTSLLSSLTGNRDTKSPAKDSLAGGSSKDSSVAGGKEAAGLDGIFAELTKPSKGPSKSSYKSLHDDDDNESSSMLGKWRRS